jgi:hypothetical protein
VWLTAQSSDATAEAYSISIRKAAQSLEVDGLLDEPAWQEAQLIRDFYQNFPFDTTFAFAKTEVRLSFDDSYLYIGATLRQPRLEYIVASLKRDFDFGSSDEFAINIDPFKDKINGFHFAVTPFNVQREGLIINGSDISIDWDNKWLSAVKNYDDHWTVEIAIPFKTLRYAVATSNNTWRLNFSRAAIKQNEWSSWVPVPRQFSANSLAFSSLLVWEDNPPKPGLNISLIPYLNARTERDYEIELPAESSVNSGGDVKVAITPSLNLDLTFNPDFSQVEVDRQITNLSRFELFFPERRQFFLENEDLFSKFGFPNTRPFFSRRIGLVNGTLMKTTTDGRKIQVNRNLNVPILAGARLSGKLDENWRIGLLNMQTAKLYDIGLNPANYAVGVVQRRVFARSYVGAVVVNKEIFIPKTDGGYQIDKDGYNRVAGLEYNLYSKDNKWEAEFYYHRSFSSGNDQDAQSAAVFMAHYTRNWRVFMPVQYVGADFRADVGFTPRRGFLSASPGVEYRWFPAREKWAKKVISYSLQLENNFVLNQPNYQLVDMGTELEFSIEFPGQSEVEIGGQMEYTYLFFPFDPTNSDGLELAANTDYRYGFGYIGYGSDQRKKFWFEAAVGGGSYFNGNIFLSEGEINYRWQPYGTLALNYTYNHIRLPKPYNSAQFWLIGPRAELSFTRNLFMSTFVQYNTQANNVNINARLQWRFQPASDVFLVYTDNYFSDQFLSDPKVKNRALVLKVTYWLNL